MYILKTLQEDFVHNNFLMGFIFWESWGPDQQNSKSPFVQDFLKIAY